MLHDIGPQLPFWPYDLILFPLLALLQLHRFFLFLKQASSHIKTFVLVLASAWNVFLPFDNIVWSDISLKSLLKYHIHSKTFPGLRVYNFKPSSTSLALSISCPAFFSPPHVPSSDEQYNLFLLSVSIYKNITKSLCLEIYRYKCAWFEET